MRKSTLFISAALTTFILAVLLGVVSAYRNVISLSPEVSAVELPQAAATAEVASIVPAPAQIISITPEEAAAIASKVINRTDLYSVEGTQFEGIDAYLVTFSSGDLVYVGLDGQVLSISQLVVTVITQGNPGGREGYPDDILVGGGGGGGDDDGGDNGDDEGGDDDNGEGGGEGEGDDD